MRHNSRPGKLSHNLLRGILLLEAVSLAVVILVIFGIYRPQLQQQTLEEAVSTSRALSRQIDIAVHSVAEYSDFYVNSPELGGCLTAYFRKPCESRREEVCDRLSRMLPTGDTSILSVFVLYDGVLFSSYSELTQADLNILHSDWIYILEQGFSDEEFSPFYTRNPDEPDGAMMYLRGFYLGSSRYLLGLICSTDRLRQDIAMLSDGVFSGYALASMSGPSFFCGGDTSGISAMLETHSTENYFQDRDSTGYYIASTIPSGEWKIVGFLSNQNFNARFTPVLIVSLLMCLLVCIMAVIMVFPFTHRLLQPVSRLRDAMEQATEGNMDVRLPPSWQDEIGELGNYFNHMLEEIRETRDKERSAQEQAQRTQYDLLTSQINAHYIYNTMSAINSLARMGRCDDVIQVNSALIRILQNNLRVQDDSLFTTVQAGLDILRSYWSIESIRPNNHAELVFDVPDEVLPLPLLKNILQPLVENSLRHGLTDEDTGEIRGRISVTITRQEKHLCIRVEDDGRGISPECLALIAGETAWDGAGRHIGLANIRKRLAFAFGENAGLRISSKYGTVVEIICPLEDSDL